MVVENGDSSFGDSTSGRAMHFVVGVQVAMKIVVIAARW